jgi:predicted RNase H-like HicB family nuclease
MSSHLINQILAKPYARVITPDRSGGYAAQVLEFPGCFSDGDTPDEAYSNLQEAAENWLESALAQGMAIPEPFAAQGYSGTVSLRLPKSLHRRAAQYAHGDGVSLNQFLVSAIAAAVGAGDFFTVLAAKLDDRLDRLDRRQTGVAMLYMEYPLEDGVTTPREVAAGEPAPLWPNVVPSAVAGTAGSPQIQRLLPGRRG